jgi:hypothetical protein
MNIISSVQTNIPSFNPKAAKMAVEVHAWKTEKILNSAKFQGRNSSKNKVITPKRKVEQQLLTTKQYTKFQCYSCKGGKKVQKTVNDVGRAVSRTDGQRQNIIRPVFPRASKKDMSISINLLFSAVHSNTI